MYQQDSALIVKKERKSQEGYMAGVDTALPLSNLLESCVLSETQMFNNKYIRYMESDSI